MNTKFSIPEILFVLLLLLLPIFYLGFLYPSLPDTVPIHYDAAGKVNGWASKKTLWTLVLLMSLVAVGLYLLLKYLPAIDPKKASGTSQKTLQKIGVGVVCLFSAINFMIVYSSGSPERNVVRLLFPLLGLFFVYMGNLSYSVKPNYFVGIRSPWTLESEDNWRATHRFGSKVFFIGGIVVIIGTLFCPVSAAVWVLEGVVAIMAIAPVLYSFLYFRKNKAE